jgi:hypothetical protein
MEQKELNVTYFFSSLPNKIQFSLQHPNKVQSAHRGELDFRNIVYMNYHITWSVTDRIMHV